MAQDNQLRFVSNWNGGELWEIAGILLYRTSDSSYVEWYQMFDKKTEQAIGLEYMRMDSSKPSE